MSAAKYKCMDCGLDFDTVHYCSKLGAIIREVDPHGRKPSEAGAKLDAGKAPTMRGAIQYFPRALQAVAAVSAYGAAKYTWGGWESVPDGVARYSDAMARHITGETIDGPKDPETDLLHAAQVAWNALARLELMLRAK